MKKYEAVGLLAELIILNNWAEFEDYFREEEENAMEWIMTNAEELAKQEWTVLESDKDGLPDLQIIVDIFNNGSMKIRVNTMPKLIIETFKKM